MTTKKFKNAPISEKFASLIDPTPSFDPEDDAVEEDTRAKLTDHFDEDDDSEEVQVSSLRRKAASVTLDDKRYAGKKISRKDLDKSSDEGESSDDGVEEEDKVAGGESSGNYDMEESDELSDDDDDNLMQDTSQDVEDGKESDSEEDSEGGEYSDDGDIFPQGGDQPEGEATAFQHFSTVDRDSEVQKGNAVKNQLLLWDNLLEIRIQMQKNVKLANQLPVSGDFPKFASAGGKEFQTAQKKCLGKVTGLLEKFLDLQNALLKQNPETKKISVNKRQKSSDNQKEDNDEEIPSSGEEIESEEEVEESKQPKKKMRLEDLSLSISDSHCNFLGFRNSTIQKWSDKTKIAQGKFSSKNFSAFEQSTLKQIEHILADRTRLLKRTRTKRSNYKILGTEEKENGEGTEDNDELLCNEIFDDDDFYHQLLRELIEHKSEGVTDPVQLGRQWISLQKLRSKMKRKIDTRATKGRKIRYTVMPKLVNFMAPVDRGDWTEEAKNELFSSLFAA
ncbi:protein AATF-like [Neocloeon triangulifer]|uniref:protein AATF-like n=1 Tax=Neocloeon triangulifer TaxID=2078957 RepID=UPI00286FAC2B|nr:protein AATF-like [Neocloeon triangulifer]